MSLSILPSTSRRTSTYVSGFGSFILNSSTFKTISSDSNSAFLDTLWPTECRKRTAVSLSILWKEVFKKIINTGLQWFSTTCQRNCMQNVPEWEKTVCLKAAHRRRWGRGSSPSACQTSHPQLHLEVWAQLAAVKGASQWICGRCFTSSHSWANTTSGGARKGKWASLTFAVFQRRGIQPLGQAWALWSSGRCILSNRGKSEGRKPNQRCLFEQIYAFSREESVKQ